MELFFNVFALKENVCSFNFTYFRNADTFIRGCAEAMISGRDDTAQFDILSSELLDEVEKKYIARSVLRNIHSRSRAHRL